VRIILCFSLPPFTLLASGLTTGFWKNKYNVDNAALDKMPAALQTHGYIAVEIEYRRRDHEGGGWPGTNDDVSAALRVMPAAVRATGLTPDLSKVILIGHSAGGTLAMWSADAAAKDPTSEYVPALVIAVAPITDLVAGFEARLSDEGDAVPLYMKGTPSELPDAYAAASPIEQLPLKVPTIVVSGAKDTDVPTAHIAPYSVAVGANRQEETDSIHFQHMEMENADHFDLVDVAGAVWPAMLDAAAKILA
jgi:acetyl esterase/lipase